jgi:hypothetical protein
MMMLELMTKIQQGPGADVKDKEFVNTAVRKYFKMYFY